VSDDWIKRAEAFLREDRRIWAIKLVREHRGIGLVEAKRLVDAWPGNPLDGEIPAAAPPQGRGVTAGPSYSYRSLLRAMESIAALVGADPSDPAAVVEAVRGMSHPAEVALPTERREIDGVLYTVTDVSSILEDES
jgi:hypothetical protein